MSAYPPLIPPPRPPLAVLPVGEGSGERGRPGILTAVGVASILVACLSMVASVGAGLAAVVVRQEVTAASARAAVRPVPPPVASASPPAAAAGGVVEVWPRGLDAGDRRTVAAGLGGLEPLSAAHRRQLDRILARAGQEMFAGTGADLTAAGVRAATRGHGTMPSDDPKDPDPVFFDTPTGQLQLHADRAFFKSYDQSVVVRSNAAADEPAAPPNPPAVPPSAPAAGKPVDPFASDDDAPAASPPPARVGSGAPAAAAGSSLTPAQVRAVVQKVQATSGNRLNSAQLAALTAALQNPNQQLVTPGAIWTPVNTAYVIPDGSAYIQLSGGPLFIIDPQGNIQYQPVGPPQPMVNISPLVPGLALIESVASLTLAVFLLVSGVLVLRQSTWGCRLHLVYAVVKLPLAVVGLVGFVSVARQLAGPGGVGGPGVATTVFFWGGVAATLAVIYPVALLVVLNTKGVRAYYRAVA